jgi:aminoglycoside phosphotransferase (APT) family kinase protein
MNNPTPVTDAKAVSEKQVASIAAWVEKHVGGKIEKIERLMRWRPVWRVEYKRDGKSKALLVKGDRPCRQLYSLKHEMLTMQVMETHGINVPHIWGWMDFPKAFVMNWAEGDRDPGLVHTALEKESKMSPERWAASLKYMEELPKIHKIPVKAFAATECGNPQIAGEIALSQFERQYAMAQEENAIDALMEFFATWLRRNSPTHRTQPYFITGDCGQFLSKGDCVTAVLDLEIAHIGDIFEDLSCFRGRHPYENMGDIPALYRHYAKAAGIELDLQVIAYHTVNFLAFAAISAILFMSPEKPEANWIEGMLEYASISRRALEAIAELQGIELDYAETLPPAHDTPIEDGALKKLLLQISVLPLSEAFLDWQRDLMAAIPRYLLNQAHYGRWYEQKSLDDLGALTGQRPASVSAGEAMLKKFIVENGAEADVALVKMLHKRMLRLSMVIAGSNPSDTNPLFFKLEPILNMEV